MAVPGSGSLSLGGLAFEKLEDEYAQGLPAAIDSSYGPFSLRDVTEGGGDTYGGSEKIMRLQINKVQAILIT